MKVPGSRDPHLSHFHKLYLLQIPLAMNRHYLWSGISCAGICLGIADPLRWHLQTSLSCCTAGLDLCHSWGFRGPILQDNGFKCHALAQAEESGCSSEMCVRHMQDPCRGFLWLMSTSPVGGFPHLEMCALIWGVVAWNVHHGNALQGDFCGAE